MTSKWATGWGLSTCQSRLSRFVGDKLIPPLIGILLLGPYKPPWVDEFIPYLCGNHGSWSTRSHIWYTDTINWVVATQTFLEFSPRKIGEMSQFDEHIFQMGWNHQLVIDVSLFITPNSFKKYLKPGVLATFLFLEALDFNKNRSKKHRRQPKKQHKLQKFSKPRKLPGTAFCEGSLPHGNLRGPP